MRLVAVLRCGNRRGPHPRRFYNRPVRIAGHTTDGTGELPGTFAPQCRLAVQLSTQANAYCERLIGNLRREYLDWLIPLSEKRLRLLVREWADHYNQGRPHLSLGPPHSGPYTGSSGEMAI